MLEGYPNMKNDENIKEAINNCIREYSIEYEFSILAERVVSSNKFNLWRRRYDHGRDS